MGVSKYKFPPGHHLFQLRSSGEQSAHGEFFNVLVSDISSSKNQTLETLLVPDSPRKYWQLDTKKWIELSSDGASIQPTSRMARLIYNFVGTHFQKPKYIYRHRVGDFFLLTAVGRRNRKTKIWSVLKSLEQFNLLPNSRYFENNSQLFNPPLSLSTRKFNPVIKPDHRSKIAIILHLHYQELWPEFSQKLLEFPIDFDLIVTLTKRNAKLSNQIKKQFGGARIVVLKNMGRDIWPLLHLLYEGFLQRHTLICKIHSKKSSRTDGETLLGKLWRRCCILDLLGSQRQICQIIERFDNNPQLGMVGPENIRTPSPIRSSTQSWGENEENSKKIMERLGLTFERNDLDFFAGSMFWCRGEILQSLKAGNFLEPDFTEERDQLPDGRIEHGFERVFGLVTRALGFTIESVSYCGEQGSASKINERKLKN